MATTSGAAPAKRSVGVRDAKARFSQLLRDAQRGHEWVITDRGRPIARLVPISNEHEPIAERLRRLELAGIVERLPQRVVPLPPPLPLKRGLARRMLDEDRGL